MRRSAPLLRGSETGLPRALRPFWRARMRLCGLREAWRRGGSPRRHPISAYHALVWLARIELSRENRRLCPAAAANLAGWRRAGEAGRGHAGGDTADRGPFMAHRRWSARSLGPTPSARRRDDAALQGRLDRLRDLVRGGGPGRAARRPGDRGVVSRRRRGTAERRRAGPPRRRHRRPAPPARSRFAGRRSAGESRSPGCPPTATEARVAPRRRDPPNWCAWRSLAPGISPGCAIAPCCC